jgi:hypothetical protein
MRMTQRGPISLILVNLNMNIQDDEPPHHRRPHENYRAVFSQLRSE